MNTGGLGSKVLRGLLTMVLALASLLGVAMISAAPAQAAPGPVLPRTSGTVTADALPTVQIDGVVWSQAVKGNTVYAGGRFTKARPANTDPGGAGETTRRNLLAYDITTGALITSFAPDLDGQVKVVALSPDKSRLYVGGQFLTANGVARSRIAAYDTTTGQLVSSFAPNVNSTITAITVTATNVYVGGWFTKINNVTRTKFAAFDLNGNLTGWAPTADGDINALVMTPNKSAVVAAGKFYNINSSPAYGVGAIDATTGALLPFPINNVVRNAGDNAGVFSLSVDDSTIYGSQFNYGTGNFEGIFAANPDGTIKWLDDCHGDTYNAFKMNDVVYAVGHAHHCENIGGFPDTNPRVHHYAMAYTEQATGTVAANNQGGSGYGNFDGQPAPSIVDWFPGMEAGSFTGLTQAAWSLTGNGTYLSAGGEFPTVNGTKQQGLVRFGLPSVAPNKRGPQVTDTTIRPTLTPIGSSVRVGWQTNWDQDDQTLTYDVYRSDKPTTPIYTTTAASMFWSRPSLVFKDLTTKAGGSYSYRVKASDPAGNSVLSPYVDVKVPSSAPSPYQDAVLADGASSYWRLGDSGTTAVDYAGNQDLAKGSGVTPSSSGAVANDPNAASDFSGTDAGSASTTVAQTAPSTFSAEAWFKTTSSSGGKILGFGNAQSGTSSSYDRHVYLDSNGRVVFGVYPGAVRTIKTSTPYNDGQWHQVVASLSSAGQKLYVDGKLIGASSTTSGQPYDGYWRVGGDNIGGWPDQPASNFFAGSIDEVAIYPTALSLSQVQTHYTKSGRTLNVPAAPADTYGKTVFADGPSTYWRLDETSGPRAVDASGNGADGTFTGNVTFSAPTQVTGGSGTAAGFDGSGAGLGSNDAITGPTTYSEELWFSTRTTRGGKLIGFGSSQSGYSGNYDRHVYMVNSGQLVFGVWTGSASTIRTSGSYNDGSWHHLVATQGSNGMALYVDGVLTGTDPQTSAQPYDGYWRVGGDSSWEGDSSYFAGSIDEVAVYPTALTGDQVKSHYRASTAAVNQPPAAAFTSTCKDASCTFDASTSTDPDGTVASYSWAFGDGQSGTGVKPDHSFTSSGTYQVTLTVTDDKGSTGSVTQAVTVTVPPPNQVPVADFTPSCVNLTCSFDGTASSDPDGTLVDYAWSFGDDTSSNQQKPNHVFDKAGTYAVKLVVTDDRGGKGSVTKQVAVTAPPNAKPVASFTASTSGRVVALDASASTDSDGTISSYAWSYGDGTSGTGKTSSHTYTSPGSFDIRLTVTDNSGDSGTLTRTVTVTTPPNQAPVAAFDATGTALTTSFDASGSSDPDGTISSYAWDFGDGGDGSGKVKGHTFAGSGVYNVKLTVTDNEGKSTSLTKAVLVAPDATAVDQFGRTISTKWGSADLGGAWTHTGAQGFSDNGSTGDVKLTAATATSNAFLASLSQTDYNVVADVKVDTAVSGNGYTHALLVRRNGTSDYRLRVRINPGGAVRLQISKVVGGTETVLKDVAASGVSYSAGDTLRVRFTATGSGTTTLSAKAWAAGTAEPTSSPATVTDTTASLQAAGSLGYLFNLGSTVSTVPVVGSLDNLVVSTR